MLVFKTKLFETRKVPIYTVVGLCERYTHRVKVFQNKTTYCY